MEQNTHVLVVGDPIDGITLYVVDGPDDPHIERYFANETWWVAPLRAISPDDGMAADGVLSDARVRMIRAYQVLETAVRAVVAERVRSVYPEAATLVAEGEWNEDGVLHLHTQRVVDADGLVLGDYSTHHTDEFDELTDEIDALLDELSERDEDWQGTHEIDITAPIPR